MKSLKLSHIYSKNYIMKFYIFLMLTFSTLVPLSTYAAPSSTDTSQITATLCNAINALTGGIGRSISILIVISLAIMLFLGKVTWGVAIAVGVGMGILFGAKEVVTILSAGTSSSDVCS